MPSPAAVRDLSIGMLGKGRQHIDEGRAAAQRQSANMPPGHKRMAREGSREGGGGGGG